MKDELARRLASLCDRPRLEVPAGRILVPEQPIDLIEASAPLMDQGARENLAWSGFAARATETLGPEAWRTVLSFGWEDPDGPWAFPLMGLAIGAPMAFLCTPLGYDGSPEAVIAGLEPRISPDLVAAFLLDAVSSNGADYGFDLFGALPQRTEDHVGLPLEVYVQAYAAWMETHPGLSSWADLRQDGPTLVRPHEDPRGMVQEYVRRTVVRVP